jgi:hypothetical protein
MDDQVLFPSRVIDFFHYQVQTAPEVSVLHLSGLKWPERKLTIHVNLVLRLRIRGTLIPLPPLNSHGFVLQQSYKCNSVYVHIIYSEQLHITYLTMFIIGI